MMQIFDISMTLFWVILFCAVLAITLGWTLYKVTKKDFIKLAKIPVVPVVKVLIGLQVLASFIVVSCAIAAIWYPVWIWAQIAGTSLIVISVAMIAVHINSSK